MPMFTISVEFQDIEAADAQEAAGLFCSILATADWSDGLTVAVTEDGDEFRHIRVFHDTVEAGLAEACPAPKAVVLSDKVQADMLAALRDWHTDLCRTASATSEGNAKLEAQRARVGAIIARAEAEA